MKLLINGLEFLSYQGVDPEERVKGHRIRLDVEADIDSAAPESDRVEDSVDYAALASRAKAHCLTVADLTLERACRRTGEALLVDFPRLTYLRLRIVKLLPALADSVESIGVEESFRR